MTTEILNYKAYRRIIPPAEREEWIFATLGRLQREINHGAAERAKLKARCTRLEKRIKELES